MATDESAQHQGSDVWEDFQQGYVPDDDLDIHPSVDLHTKTAKDIDTVTYEVLRHRLWTLNEEHGQTLENVSGSPVAYFGQDFNPTLMNEEGEVVFNGPYVQLFSPIAELQVKWILENRSDNPGIEPGDIFISNDPWVGSTHQPDVFFVAPIFKDGEIFCWIANTLHQYDLGGINAGSFCPGADDVYQESTPIPPVKAVEGGDVRKDIKQMYQRHSRMPDMVGLDFNAQVAGLQVTQEQIHELIGEYGAQTIKGVMEQIIEDSESKFLEKLRELPDGTWRTREFMEGSQTGDDDLYVAELQLKKEGDELTFTNEGSADNAGSMNLTYAGFRTAISCVVNPMMLYDQLWVTSGAYRHIDINTEPGTLNRAEYPQGVSCGGTLSIELSIALIYDVMTRMLSTSDETREDIITDPLAGLIVLSQAGIDQWDNPFGTMNLDVMGTGFGARTNKDGIDVGGILFSPKGPLPNIENNEQDYPMLYLYRRESKDSAGHGEYRGGGGMDSCFIPHNTNAIQTVVAGNGGVTPNTRGISSYPGAPIRSRTVDDSDILERFESQEIPEDIEEVDGEEQLYPPKAELLQEPTDVMETRSPGTAGYGDPINRDPEKVLQDIKDEIISLESANDIYGVVFEGDGDDITVDEQATEERREELIEMRLEESIIPAEE
jgi:N-methylhydantoinase B